MAAVEVVMEGNPPGKAPGGVSISRRPKKAQVIESDSEDERMENGRDEGFVLSSNSGPINYSMDISQLEAPTFTTLDRGPCPSMTSLKWDHGVNLIGKKVVNPMIHCCDKCLKPILIYGRMIPCKHVFCLRCAQSEKNGSCSRCGDKVSHVDHAGLGSIYMCSHGGSRYGNNGCRRTYLSQRDLQAHIRHRHLKANSNNVTETNSSSSGPSAAIPPQNTPSVLVQPPPCVLESAPPNSSSSSLLGAPLPGNNVLVSSSPRVVVPLLSKQQTPDYSSLPPRSSSASSYSPRTLIPTPIQPISVISSNRTASNLITVPIEGSENNGGDIHHHHHQQQHHLYGAPGAYYNGAGGGSASAGSLVVQGHPAYAAYPNYSHPPPNYGAASSSGGDPSSYYGGGGPTASSSSNNYESAYNSGSGGASGGANVVVGSNGSSSSYRTTSSSSSTNNGSAASYYGPNSGGGRR